MKSPNSHIIIHAFALTHALVSLLCQLGGIVVSNLKRPKLSPEAGSGLGLKYLIKQYRDLTPRPVTADQNDREFIITLPLL